MLGFAFHGEPFIVSTGAQRNSGFPPCMGRVGNRGRGANLALVSAKKPCEDHTTNMVGSSQDRILLFKVIN